ncbi:hypothetical protein C8J57DRAFT_522711 [Mycena rebaudengoi]|nr:hypothetical protein C8J57DRAFT_522711 [Mycena rebaudengoi]
MLQVMPPELLSLIALHLATFPSSSEDSSLGITLTRQPLSLGPPAALIPLLLTSRYVHTALTASPALFAGICKAKFGWADVRREANLYPSLQGPSRSAAAYKSRLVHLCAVLRVLREGDVHCEQAAWAMGEAWAMLVGDEWVDCEVGGGEHSIGAVGHGYGSTAANSQNAPRAWVLVPKNRTQLEWAGAEAFAERYLRERVYGRQRWFASFLDGEESEDDADEMAAAEGDEGGPEDPGGGAQFAAGGRGGGGYRPDGRGRGWPVDSPAAASALWVLWFFASEAKLGAESEEQRRDAMSLLLPFVTIPYRVSSSF